ncbi:unnamed protein product [Heligmosomoides polygyrus]|uniref:BPI2 domain-containing protein n=1 Tax=Heligmosomoides polygyrus TaxID=6339 RepID=A0A183GU26_HELPZ|nr:unnamed protein product [Heligmosomoides polygyrus]
MVDIACAGEISYRGEGGTPFGPPPIAWLRSQSDTHMLMLQVSDYLPNSLFYHAHKIQLESDDCSPFEAAEISLILSQPDDATHILYDPLE